jgi:lipopolysaccharide transport system ATP-binding protein
VDPDILVIDEALAVGDQAFQVKCLERIDALRASGGTIVLVSHALELVAHHCRTTYLLDRGRLSAGGDTAATLAAYLSSLNNNGRDATPLVAIHANEDRMADQVVAHPWYTGAETRWGDGKARIVAVHIEQDGIVSPPQVTAGRPVEIAFEVICAAAVSRPVFGLAIKSSRGALLYSANSRELGGTLRDCGAGNRVRATFRITPFLDTDRYILSFGVVSESPHGPRPHDRRYDALAMTIAAPRTSSGELDMHPAFALEIMA